MSEAELRLSLAKECDKVSLDWYWASLCMVIQETYHEQITDDTPWVRVILYEKRLKELNKKSK